MQQVADTLGCGHTFKYQDVGVYFGEPEKTVPDPYFNGRGPDRTGCRLCGGCMVGCRYNAKNTLVKNYLYLAEKLGAQVFPETKATLIREDDGGYRVDTIRSTAVIAVRRTTFKCRQLVIAAGVLGTLRLLLHCREKGALTRLSPMLGARVRTNSESLTGATARKKDVDYSQGVAITSSIYPDAVTHIEPVRFPAGSDLLGLLVATVFTESAHPLLRPLKWIRAIVRHPLDYLRTLWPLGWARRTVILLVMQTLENSVQVYRKRRWWWPFHVSPKPRQPRKSWPRKSTAYRKMPLTKFFSILVPRPIYWGDAPSARIPKQALLTGRTACMVTRGWLLWTAP
jgi:cholesterol oxidase